jgi:exodeoxyribonuclease-1
LRPDGIVWPTNDEGKVSFRLEHLSAANHLVHESAHDALSDVRATIALARLVKHIHPKLFDFCFSLHSKERVAAEISLLSPRPFLHISGMLPVENGCMCIAWPLAQHPTNKNEIIVWNLAYDPRELVGLSADTIRKRMFSKTEDLPEGVSRLPIKSIHLNKSPIVIQNLKTLQPDIAERRNISLSKAMENAEHARTLPTMNDIWLQVFKREPNEPVDVDQDLYNGFVSNGDRRQLQLLTTLSPEKLATTTPRFEDARLHELLFRYRARHFSTTLTPEENQRWETLRASRFFEGNGGALTVDAYFADIDRLSAKANEKEAAILAALYDYAEQIVPVNC